jgi:hypothetical protein
MVPDLLCGVFFRLSAVRCDGVSDLVCNARSRCARSKDYHTHVLELQLAHVETRHYCSESYTSSSLDIIVETGNLRCVPIEDSSSWENQFRSENSRLGLPLGKPKSSK